MTAPAQRPASTSDAAKRKAEEIAEKFNTYWPIGTPVLYWPGVREGDGIESVTRSEAWVLGGHTPVVMVEGHAGGVSLDHVMPLPPADPTPAEPDADDLARLAGGLSDAAWPHECPHDDNDPHAPCWDCVAVAAVQLLASRTWPYPRTPDAHLAAYIESLIEWDPAAMDLWWRASGDDWPVPVDLPGKFLREVLRAARLREQGGGQ